MLADGLSSRLNKALVYDKPVATQVSSFNISAEIGSVFVVQATARPGSSLAEIEKTVTAEIARLAKEGPTAAELERSKTKQEAEFISGLERIGGFGGKADVLNQYNAFLGDPNKIEADLTRYRSLTTADVQQAVATWLDTPNRVVIRFHPEKSQRPPNALTLDRLADAAARRGPAVHGAEGARRRSSPNGLELFVVERRDLPKVNVTLVTRAGAVGDPAGKAGVANLTVTAIDMGTQDAEGARGRAGLRRPRHDADRRRRSRERAARAGRAVAEPVAGPGAACRRRPEPDVPGRARSRASASACSTRIAQADRNGNALAARIQPMLAFGPDHPYGRPVQGLKGSVEGITRADLVAFHQARVKPGSTAIVLAGDISLAQATELVTQALRRRGAAGPRPTITIPAAPAPKGGRIYLVDRPDAAQTVVAQWIPGPARTTPDYDVLEPRRRGVGRRRLRHAAEPEPAREQGLLVRRVLELQPDARGGELGRRRRRADRQDGRVDRRVRQGAEGPGRRASDQRR